MINKRILTSLNKDPKKTRSCNLCRQKKGLNNLARLCRKCIKDGIRGSGYKR